MSSPNVSKNSCTESVCTPRIHASYQEPLLKSLDSVFSTSCAASFVLRLLGVGAILRARHERSSAHRMRKASGAPHVTVKP